ncbi:peptide chain release factor N(5)-glutamine methyltransferase [Myxacorys almedinensis]|uniref:Release factor glutamine methyltransferase n=1 Tax=Myxacorys almedinensis A TaxID=2690445 RepID=A0A8J7YX65_9CYAN|nr:peptide chain release factor N(5)-glutamine methyltransferase [Myxacorys almedinensis]NDJ16244.1 peptide chain release factor N(5)-glutamine methyltransferase [Myxacorys almedinensis A]
MVVSGLDLWQWQQQAKAAATAASVSPDEVDWLLQELAGIDRLSLRLDTFKAQDVSLSISLDALDALWQRRIHDQVPVQYLAGVAPWRDFSLRVSPAVLIPRPETEFLIDLAIARARQDHQTGHWVDLGTGSGAIAIALATAFPHATIHAVDHSSEALAIAQTNAATLGLAERIQFYQGSWFGPLDHLRGQLSAVVSNPPYIPSKMILELQPEVRLHEPHQALDGGHDGLDCIRHLVAIAPDFLKPNGIWMTEMMAGQADAVMALLKAQDCYKRIGVHQDLAGIERFAIANRV